MLPLVVAPSIVPPLEKRVLFDQRETPSTSLTEVYAHPEPKTPRTPGEFSDRMKYPIELLRYANVLCASGAPLDDVKAAYEKADKAQKGFYYYDDTDKAKKQLKKHKIAIFDQETGVLTLPKGKGKHFSVGQKILCAKNTNFIFCDNKSGIKFIDAKTNAFAKSIVARKVGYSTTTGHFIKCEKGQKVDFSNYELSSDQTNEVTISEIKELTKDKKRDFEQKVNAYFTTRCPLFDISKEHAAVKKLIENRQSFKTEDLHCDSPIALKKWLELPLDPTFEKLKIDPDNVKGNIYIFGTCNFKPKNGLYEQQYKLNRNAFYDEEYKLYENGKKGYPGVPLSLNKEKLIKLGRVEENSFLSNAYPKELVIPGERKPSYQSVTHYLFHKSFEKSPKKHAALATLEKQMDVFQDAREAYFHYQTTVRYHMILPVGISVFDGLDAELKKALYYKFTTDGKPNEEGKKLMNTGDAKLYAGCEIGYEGFLNGHDRSFGMVFVHRNSKTGELIMEGGNKFGRCLMELRQILREL